VYDHLIGLKLQEAERILRQQPNGEALELEVQETAPPFTPKFRRPIFGEFRVLRVCPTGDNTLQLLAARELLGEEILEKK
jgi:hypothetical protein